MTALEATRLEAAELTQRYNEEADNGKLGIVTLSVYHASISKAMLKYSDAVTLMKGALEEAERIHDPEVKVSATQIIAENYNHSRDAYREIGFDLG